MNSLFVLSSEKRLDQVMAYENEEDSDVIVVIKHLSMDGWDLA